MVPHLPSRTAVAAALALAIAAGLAAGTPAIAQSSDLRSPDARDAAATAPAPAGADLRSVDARDAARAALAPAGEDLRSADARDAGRPEPEPVPGLPTWPIDPVPINAPAPVVADDAPIAFQWEDAAVGAAGMLGLVLLLAGAAALITRWQRTATA